MKPESGFTGSAGLRHTFVRFYLTVGLRWWWGGMTDNYRADSEQVSVRGKEEAALPVFSKERSKRDHEQEAPSEVLK